MSKPIVLTNEYIESMVADFRKHLADAKMSEGKITFTRSFEYKGEDDANVSVMFTPMAYVKMLALLRHFDSEVAWHGTVDRKADDLFVITDIIVYPQEVSGATVNTDQEEYQKWLMNLDDDFFNAMRMQGHSHVSFGTTPSTVDLTHQEQILKQLNGTSFYIFMIWNKKLEHNIKVFDYATNTLYENKDVVVGVLGDGFDEESFLAESDAVVKKRVIAPATTPMSTYTGNGYVYGGGTSYSYNTTPAVTGKTEPKSSTTAKTDKAASPKKRGRPPKNATNKTVVSDDKPGLYGGYDATQVNDWDEEIFGSRRYSHAQ